VSALSMLKLLPYPAASHPSGQILFERQDLLKANESSCVRCAATRSP
jgi:microcin C transport system ATP-binding protein